MTAVSPLVFPGSRTLAGWWKQLAPLRPRALWVGHLLLHRVEALAIAQLPAEVDAFSLFVLRALALTGAGSLQALEQCLHLGLPLLHQLLRQLHGEKLVQEESGTWSLTDLGRQGAECGRYVRASSERRTFYFVDAEQPAGMPHFLHFAKQPLTLAWSGLDGWRFEAGHLQACVNQAEEWKRRFAFPLEVRQILVPDKHESSVLTSEAWQRIILDRPERLVAALVLAPAALPAGGDANRARLLGLAVQADGWALQIAEPAFVLEEDWQEVFPELAVDPPLELWQQAWRTWCQPRGLPLAEVDACVLTRQGYRLCVTAPRRLVERLRAARSDVFKGEAWLLAGAGRLRAAAQVELVEPQHERPLSV